MPIVIRTQPYAAFYRRRLYCSPVGYSTLTDYFWYNARDYSTTSWTCSRFSRPRWHSFICGHIFYMTCCSRNTSLGCPRVTFWRCQTSFLNILWSHSLNLCYGEEDFFLSADMFFAFEDGIYTATAGFLATATTGRMSLFAPYYYFAVYNYCDGYDNNKPNYSPTCGHHHFWVLLRYFFLWIWKCRHFEGRLGFAGKGCHLQLMLLVLAY